ncbi:MAG TPA: chromosomal replication initiator protein DnaA, partial [Spirochaetota bacterium]|nr:chromosomal replication initiator protein DnaA [Spirochaetota bacterium]
MGEGYGIFWEGVKKELELILSPNDMNVWISRIEYHDFDEKINKMSLSVPSIFIKDNVSKFKDNISQILSVISGLKCSVDFIVLKPQETQPAEEPPPFKTDIPKSNENEKSVKIESEPTVKTGGVKTNFDAIEQAENFSFDSFVIGSSNEFAAHAARAVAENPGTQYNPYFIYGDSGLGKTHLIKSIERYVKENFPTKKVKYVTSEDFTNDFVNAIRTKTNEQFRAKYRELDVLIIDDIQFFADKEGLQGEFFHTFNKLYDNNKQMIFSCDQPIQKLKSVEDRIKSRFSMGLTVDLRPPDFELRMAILKNLTDIYRLDIKNDAMEYICSNNVGNIRDLKGTFKDLLAYSSIMKVKTITLEVALLRLKDKITKNLYSSPVSVDKVIHIVAEYYNLKSSDVTGEKRTKSIALARQIAMYLSRKATKLSTTQIGTYFGDKEHGTVMHATKKIEDLNNSDQKKKETLKFL